MKILITGAAGLLGIEVWRAFENAGEQAELFAFGRTKPPQTDRTHWLEGDIRDAETTYQLITKTNPDAIVHCAAYNDVDGAERNADEAFQVNALGARNLAQACQRFDAALYMVSTDYVFSGQDAPQKTGYREGDPVHPISRYGESKALGENFVRDLLSRWAILRTSWLFGAARATFVDKIITWSLNGQPIPCLKDIVSAPTFVADLAGAIHALVMKRRFGTYHLTNSGFCSRVELAQEVLRINGLSGKIQSLTQAELHLPAQRPAFSGLDNMLWRLDGFEPLPTWQNALGRHFRKSVEVSR